MAARTIPRSDGPPIVVPLAELPSADELVEALLGVTPPAPLAVWVDFLGAYAEAGRPADVECLIEWTKETSAWRRAARAARAAPAPEAPRVLAPSRADRARRRTPTHSLTPPRPPPTAQRSSPS